MEAIILAGGFGTRLQPVVKAVPKPMADINGRPFLSYLTEYLQKYDVHKVFLSVGYKHDVIREYFGSKYQHIDIDYIIESEPLGTGGAIKEALKRTREENVLVLNGDTFFKIDLNHLLLFHCAEDADITLAVKPMQNFDRYGSVVLSGTKLIGFEEKTFKTSGLINGGVYMIQKKIFNNFKQKVFNFESDFLRKNIDAVKIRVFACNNYFIDIGIPEDYERARKELAGFFQGALK